MKLGDRKQLAFAVGVLIIGVPISVIFTVYRISLIGLITFKSILLNIIIPDIIILAGLFIISLLCTTIIENKGK